jgi:2-amino-4-hydroxy-6-hydroxymethyldihydropteridine diphosphokinase
MNKTSRALIGLGTNLPFEGLVGPALLEAALRALEEAGLPVLAVSSAWRSAAWPDPSQPAFTNAVAALDPSGKTPDEVYAMLAQVERQFGRERGERNSARTLDLDLLDCGGLIGNFCGVQIPHYAIAERVFVLAPLAEVDAKWMHPGLGRPIDALLAALKGGDWPQRIGPLRIAPPRHAD